MKTKNLKEIELSYDTQSVLYKGDYVWPILRFKINEEIRGREGITPRTLSLNRGLIKKLFGTLFYGVMELLRLKRYDIWVFSSSDRRKKINGKYVDRIIEPIADQYSNTLVIENPFPLGKHYKKRDLKNNHIISLTIFYAITRFFSWFLGRNPKIENETLLIKILEESNLDLDYKTLVRNYEAQYRCVKFLMRFSKPKIAFFVYASSSMGYIKAFKEKKIPVVEIQHGVINELHYAYNVFKDFGDRIFPDYLLTYGTNEIAIFDENNFFIPAKNVLPVGYYFLEESLRAPKEVAVEKELRSDFKKIVTVSLQDPFVHFVFEFLEKVSGLDPTILYILVPRDPNKEYERKITAKNVHIERKLNVYECLKFADYHMTINSTCAIESLCFGVPNILYDYNDWASNYYGSVLNDVKHTLFVKSPEECVKAIHSDQFHAKDKITEDSNVFIKQGFKENIKKIIESHISND